jgi:hypothetical protein
MIHEQRHRPIHVLVSLPAEETARHTLLVLTLEGIPRELLRIERSAVKPLRSPHLLAPYIVFGVLAAGATGGALLVADRLYGGVMCALYGGAVGLLLGMALDAWRRARYERRRTQRERSGFEIVCPEEVLVQAEKC